MLLVMQETKSGCFFLNTVRPTEHSRAVQSSQLTDRQSAHPSVWPSVCPSIRSSHQLTRSVTLSDDTFVRLSILLWRWRVTSATHAGDCMLGRYWPHISS